jgi:tetratricopeptide (TPR) repeat protein
MCLGLMLPLSGCTKKLEARMEMKKGNSAYKQEKYRDALEFFQRGLEMDPKATFAWRSVGLSAMALFRPGNEEPENLRYADLALTGFQNYLKDYPEAPKILDYMVNMFINAKRVEDGVAFMKYFAEAHPRRIDAHQSLVVLLTKVGQVEQALDWANTHETARNDPQVYYTIGVNAWDLSYNDVRLTPEERAAVVDAGLVAMERALQLKKEFQTLVYYNLLYREKAKFFDADPVKQQEFIGLANRYAAEAAEVRKAEDEAKKAAEAAAAAKSAGRGGPSAPPAPQEEVPPAEAAPGGEAGEAESAPEGEPGAEEPAEPEAEGTQEEAPAAVP